MTLRAAVVAGLLALVGCSGSSGGADAGGQGGQDAGADAGGCFVRDAGCAAQSDCGSIDGTQAYACVSGRCTLEAGFGTACTYDIPIAQVQVTLSPAWGSQLPRSLEVRAFYPFKTDGSPLGCAGVLNTTDLPDGGSPLDVDPTLNLENLGAYAASCSSGGSCQYVLNTNVVRGTSPVILVQGYTGGSQPDGLHATGLRLGEGCTDGTAATQDAQTFQVTIAP